MYATTATSVQRGRRDRAGASRGAGCRPGPPTSWPGITRPTASDHDEQRRKCAIRVGRGPEPPARGGGLPVASTAVPVLRVALFTWPSWDGPHCMPRVKRYSRGSTVPPHGGCRVPIRWLDVRRPRYDRHLRRSFRRRVRAVGALDLRPAPAAARAAAARPLDARVAPAVVARACARARSGDSRETRPEQPVRTWLRSGSRTTSPMARSARRKTAKAAALADGPVRPGLEPYRRGCRRDRRSGRTSTRAWPNGGPPQPTIRQAALAARGAPLRISAFAECLLAGRDADLSNPRPAASMKPSRRSSSTTTSPIGRPTSRPGDGTRSSPACRTARRSRRNEPGTGGPSWWR